MAMNRYKASATHFTISAMVIAVFFAIVFFVWYPMPYFYIEGTLDVIIVLVGVDVVLGPLLTLIVFKPNKPSLKFDLSVIALIQISALLYGANTIYSERPYFVAFAVDRFIIVHATDVKKMDLSLINPKINYHQLGPSYVYAENPTDPAVKSKILEGVLAGGPDIDHQPELYRDFKTSIPQSFSRSLELDKLAKQYPGNQTIIDAFRKKHPNAESFALYPLAGKHSDVVLVLDKTNAEIIDYIDINPWNVLKQTAPHQPEQVDLEEMLKFKAPDENSPLKGLPGAPFSND